MLILGRVALTLSTSVCCLNVLLDPALLLDAQMVVVAMGGVMLRVRAQRSTPMMKPMSPSPSPEVDQDETPVVPGLSPWP